MRFRAKIVDIGCIQHFSKVVGTIAKLAKNCILRITPNKLYFILTERVANGGVGIWCELMQSHFFNEYSMDGVSEEDNEIYLEVCPDSLTRSLKSAQNAKTVKIKLTKRHTSCITFEIELPSLTNQSRLVVHDIPVRVIPRRLWVDYQEPKVPDFDVSIYMPALKMLRNVVERMKNISNYVVISANWCGEMQLKVETDLAAITTHFRDLQNPVLDKGNTSQTSQSQQSRDRDVEEFAEARIDIRKLAQFLIGQQVNPDKVICNIVDNRFIHFFLLHEDMSLQYFMPVITL
ncbi:checkpoint protein HUS1-like [Lineus longissimus]|uniref:checkpoint protein HUS1-like n=1 Tax=Lineus longissimus TaxID=88925 RepID=UPI002B4D5948